MYDLDEEIHQVGTFVKISHLSANPEKIQLTLEGHRRIKIISAAPTETKKEEEGPIERFLSGSDEEVDNDHGDRGNDDGDGGNDGGDPILLANVENYEDFPFEQTPELKQTSEEVVNTVRKIIGKNPHFHDVSQQVSKTRVGIQDFGCIISLRNE